MTYSALFKLVFSSIFLCIGFACNPSVDTKQETSASTPHTNTTTVAKNGQLEPVVRCLNNPSLSYALYIPEAGENQNLPVLFFFDPHGEGKVPLEKYRSLADEFKIILAASNNSKNGVDANTLNVICNSMIEDCLKRLPVDSNKLFTAGFSGGGKVAAMAAINNALISGVISQGAALHEATQPGHRFSYVLMSGWQDLNLTDILETEKTTKSAQRICQLLVYPGSHEWADVNNMRLAVYCLFKNNERQNGFSLNETITTSVSDTLKKRIDYYFTNSMLTHSARYCRLALNVTDRQQPDYSYFSNALERIIKSKDYQLQLKYEQQLFEKESKIKEQLIQQLSNPDLKVWQRILEEFRKNSEATDPSGDLYKRLLSFISLACYSYSNQTLVSQHVSASAYVDLYMAADPENSEPYYLKAILEARNKNSQGVESNLAQAIHHGFKDLNRMQNQPEFQSLNSSVNFEALIEAIDINQE